MLRLVSFFACFLVTFAFPDQGQWSKTYTRLEESVFFGAHKSLSGGSTISVSLSCEPADSSEKAQIKVGWVLRQTSCFEEYYLESDMFSEEVLHMYYNCPMNTNGYSKVRYLIYKEETLNCTSPIQLQFLNESFLPNPSTPKAHIPPGCNEGYLGNSFDDNTERYLRPPAEYIIPKSPEGSNIPESGSNTPSKSGNKVPLPSDNSGKDQVAAETTRTKRELTKAGDGGEDGGTNATHTDHVDKPPDEAKEPVLVTGPSGHLVGNPRQSSNKHGSKVAVTDMDGIFLFVMKIESDKESIVNVTVAVTMKSDYGFLSAADYPLLWFYGFMCGLYVVYAFGWLVVSALQWRDLLRIQFWIGGVILLGLIEKAVFYAEYQSINSTGQSVQGAVLFAEILSCLKRTLARMLVIIVSLGFGIVKPRLGPTLHRVVGVGALYFFLGTLEGCLRVLKPKNDLSKQALIAGIPLAVTDSAICWWIFSSLVQTLRTLRLRRNLVKLALYQHFTNTLIFAVLASVAFMVWSIRSHKLVSCITDWKELWVDEAYWHLLFSLILLVIMILWRPTQNNQRYAFTPLLDAYDDENDDFDTSITNDAFDGMKMRTTKSSQNSPQAHNDLKNKQDEDLKWVEENIPSSLPEVALPTLLDSDEEIMTAKFERNKME